MRARTTNKAAHDVALVLQSFGIDARTITAGDGSTPSVAIATLGEELLLDITAASAPSLPMVRQLVERGRPSQPAAAPILVADRLSASAREMLTDRGWGWLDRRGHMRLVDPTHAVVIDADMPTLLHDRVSDPLDSTVGKDVAAELLLDPTAEWGVRDLAARLGRAPSSVSVVLRELRSASLLDRRNRPHAVALFEALASHWTPRSVLLATSPTTNAVADVPRLRARVDQLDDEGWALTDSLAAIAWGARFPVGSAHAPDLYVPDESVLVVAAERFGRAASVADAAARLLVAPIRRATTPRFREQLAMFDDWPLAHPLFVALEIARDPGRGAELLDTWTPPLPRFHRVW